MRAENNHSILGQPTRYQQKTPKILLMQFLFASPSSAMDVGASTHSETGNSATLYGADSLLHCNSNGKQQAYRINVLAIHYFFRLRSSPLRVRSVQRRSLPMRWLCGWTIFAQGNSSSSANWRASRTTLMRVQ